MTDILTKLTERRAELMRQSDEHHKAILAITRDARVTDAALAEIDFAIAASRGVALSEPKNPRAPKRQIQAWVLCCGSNGLETDMEIPISPNPDPAAFAEHYERGLDGAAAHDQFEGTARLKLLDFLKWWPDSTMVDINAAGIPAAEVYNAEKAGAVILKVHNFATNGAFRSVVMYALPGAEAQQSEAAE